MIRRTRLFVAVDETEDRAEIVYDFRVRRFLRVGAPNPIAVLRVIARSSGWVSGMGRK